ncbi:Pentapeptide repeats (8 copies) [uncultured archaeon]|nr:Pentapeptide repeats (8 copies) [uncultured archaeon]
MELPLIFKDFLGRRDYLSKDEIIEFVKNSKNYDSSREKLAETAVLLIFQTTKQQTWLVSTNEKLYCILDDNRENKPYIDWSIPKRVLIEGKSLSKEIKIREHSDDIGIVDIGPKKDWFYSKKLFKNSDIKTSIIHLVKENLKGADLSGVNLCDANLEGANLEKANLEGANLSGAKFTKTIFNGANLKKAIILNKAILKRAQFELSDLQEAQLEGADLTEAQLEGANLELANLTSAILDSANLRKSKLYGANLSNANIRHTDLKNAFFDKNTDFRGVEYDSVTIDCLRGSNWEEVALMDENMKKDLMNKYRMK